MKKVIFFVFAFACVMASANSGKYPYQNSKLPISQRVEDLMSRMSLEEKVNQMSAQLLFMDQFYEKRDYTKQSGSCLHNWLLNIYRWGLHTAQMFYRRAPIFGKEGFCHWRSKSYAERRINKEGHTAINCIRESAHLPVTAHIVARHHRKNPSCRRNCTNNK